MTNDPNEVHIAVNKIKNAKKKLGKIRGELKNSNWKIIWGLLVTPFFLSDEPATQSRGGYLTRPPGLVDLFYSILNQGISVLAEYGETVVGISTHFIYQRGG